MRAPPRRLSSWSRAGPKHRSKTPTEGPQVGPRARSQPGRQLQLALVGVNQDLSTVAQDITPTPSPFVIKSCHPHRYRGTWGIPLVAPSLSSRPGHGPRAPDKRSESRPLKPRVKPPRHPTHADLSPSHSLGGRCASHPGTSTKMEKTGRTRRPLTRVRRMPTDRSLNALCIHRGWGVCSQSSFSQLRSSSGTLEALDEVGFLRLP